MLNDDAHELDAAPRVRSVSEGRLVTRATRSLMAPYAEQLAVWYPRLAHLRAAALRPDLSVVRSAGVFRAEVAKARTQLDDHARAAPEPIRSHSIVRDLQRAYQRLEDELRDLGA